MVLHAAAFCSGNRSLWSSRVCRTEAVTDARLIAAKVKRSRARLLGARASSGLSGIPARSLSRMNGLPGPDAAEETSLRLPDAGRLSNYQFSEAPAGASSPETDQFRRYRNYFAPRKFSSLPPCRSDASAVDFARTHTVSSWTRRALWRETMTERL